MRRLYNVIFIVIFLFVYTVRSASAVESIDANFVVDANGTGQFTTVQAAVDAAPENNTKPFVILIKPGVYKERVIVPRSKRFVRFIGEDPEKTVLTFDLYAGIKGEDGKEIGTFRTPSTTIEADDFTAENITFENSAGPVGQALAITIIGDRCVFRNCRFLGWQDTVLSQVGRHYFERCYIAGHCDFIFGGATAFFESCHIHCLRDGYITAAATPQQQPYGYVFSNCKITGQSPDVKTYLGRPWRWYASVIFMNTEMSEVVRPVGWHNWGQPDREKTSRYAEYNSTGPGANPLARVPWARRLTEEEAKDITVEKVLGGLDGWNPITGEVKSEIKVIPDSKSGATSDSKNVDNDSVYFFTAFHSNGEDGLYLVYSFDGYKWDDLNGPFLKPELGTQKLMSDPSIVRGPDGTFHLVWTTSLKGDKGFGYAASKDLMNWSQQEFVGVMSDEEQTTYVLSPELYYDAKEQQFIILWASTILPNYFQAFQEDTSDNPRLWYTTTRDFETFTKAKPFWDPGYSVRDSVIIQFNNKYVLIHNNNSRMMQDLHAAFSDTPLGPWSYSTGSFTGKFSKSPAVLKIGDELIVYYSVNNGEQYRAAKTRDFVIWTDMTSRVSLPRGYNYGIIFKSPRVILGNLKSR